jgi:hypothetical protein
MELVREWERVAEKRENVLLRILNVFWEHLEWAELESLSGPEISERSDSEKRG